MTMAAFASRIVKSTNLIGLFINNNCSTRGIFANSYIQATINLIKNLSVCIRYVGTYDILWKRICWDNSFFIESIQKNLCIAFLSAFFYSKKFGMRLTFFFKYIERFFQLILKH